MDIEVKVTWDQIGSHGANPEAVWAASGFRKDSPGWNAIKLLLETNTTVTLRDDDIGCTLVYREKKYDEQI